MPGQDQKESDDGMWLVTMGAFKLDLLLYAAVGTKVDVFHKEQRRSGPFGWSGPLVDKWVPGNADSIRIRNTYYGATAANANYIGLGQCPPLGESSGQRPSLDCRLWSVGASVSYTFDQAVGLSGSGPGGLPPNPGPGGGAKLDVRAVSGIANVTIGTWQPVLSVESAGFPPEWVPPEGQALTSAPSEVDSGKRITCVRLDSEGRIAEVGGIETTAPNGGSPSRARSRLWT